MTENESNMRIKHAVCVLEAIGNGLTLSNENDREDACAFAIQALEEIQQYRAIGTVEECRVAVERMKPKKQIIPDRRIQNGDEVCTEWKCPVCGLNVIEEPPCQEYCQRCGNKLDWDE